MNWKKSLSTVILYAVVMLAVFSFRYPKAEDVMSNATLSCALAMGIVGSRELDGLGYGRLGALLLLCLVPISIAMFLWASTILKMYSESSFCAVSMLFAAPLPVAAFLSHKKSEHSPLPGRDNAS